MFLLEAQNIVGNPFAQCGCECLAVDDLCNRAIFFFVWGFSTVRHNPTLLGRGWPTRSPSIFGDPVCIVFDPAQREEMHLLNAEVRMALLMGGKLGQ